MMQHATLLACHRLPSGSREAGPLQVVRAGPDALQCIRICSAALGEPSCCRSAATVLSTK